LRFTKSFFVLVLVCVSTAAIAAQEIPDAILGAIRNAPEDVIAGIGMARAESEWESMSLAMTRARVQIVRALSSEIHSEFRDYKTENELSTVIMSYEEEEVNVLSAANINGSRVVVLTRTSDGAWWCAVYMNKYLASVTPRQIYSSSHYLSDPSKAPSINGIRVVSDINSWINNLGNLTEGMLFGIGVARLDSYELSYNLAKERAVKSIAHTLHADISSVVKNQTVVSASYDNGSYTESFENPLFENNISLKSNYEDKDIPVGLIDVVRTEDGLLWVALGCEAEFEYGLLIPGLDELLRVPSFLFDAEARMDEAFERAAREVW